MVLGAKERCGRRVLGGAGFEGDTFSCAGDQKRRAALWSWRSSLDNVGWHNVKLERGPELSGAPGRFLRCTVLGLRHSQNDLSKS